MNPWVLVGAVVASTVAADVLQAREMKRYGESSVQDTAVRVFQRPLLAASIGCMALSFFSFLALLRVADLSFAVPATSISIVVETAMARWVLREHVNPRRWIAAVCVTTGVALLAL